MAINRRYRLALVVVIELGVACACAYLGVQALGHGSASALQRLGPAPAASTAPALSPGLVPLGQPSPTPRPAPGASLAPGLIDRLSQDDYQLYQKQWQVIGLLMQGIRRYVEQRLVPSINSIHH